MLVTLSGIVTVMSELQEENARSPMLVTLPGIVMLSSESQPLNAEFPMLVTLFGIVTLVRKSHQLNAQSAIVFVPAFLLVLAVFALVLYLFFFRFL